MGFRNPITSATAVDTRPGSGAAGVTVSGASTSYYDGYGGSATIGLTTPAGGGTGGTDFAIKGATRFTTGAGIDLGENGLPAGGYEAVATITADRAKLAGAAATRGLDPGVARTLLTYPDTTKWGPFTGSSEYDTAHAIKDAAGVVHLGGFITVLTAGAWGANAPIAQIPPNLGLWPPHGAYFTVPAFSNGASMELYISTTGVLSWLGSSSGVAYAVNQVISLWPVSYYVPSN